LEQVEVGAASESEFIEVMDLVFYLAVPGVDGQPATLQYTVRPSEGDVYGQQEGGVNIQFAPRDVLVGTERKRVPGRKVMLSSTHLVGLERVTRYDRRERPSLKFIADREKAEVEALKKKLGVE
jgi:hypothetical protein